MSTDYCVLPHVFTPESGDIIMCAICGLVINPEKLMKLSG